MITEKVKAQAIAKMKHRIPLDEISNELDIPVKLLKEWSDNFDPSDMIAIEANIQAVQKVVNGNVEINGEVVEINDDILKEQLELTAIDIAKQACIASISADMVHAKSIQLCADAVTKLYQTIIMKGGTGEPNKKGNSNIPVFAQLMKD